MASGSQILDASGRRYLDADGKRRIVGATASDCVCCGPVNPYPCSTCSPSLPASVEVTFSGLTLCSGCIRVGDLGGYDGTYVLSGTYTLPAISACRFLAYFPISESSLYNAFNCTGDVLTYDELKIEVELFTDYSQVDAQMYCTDCPGAIDYTVLLFTGQVTGLANPRDCLPFTASNSYTDCETPPTLSPANYGGTAAVVRP